MISSGREDLVELICLVAESAGTHGKFNLLTLDTFCGNNNTTVFAQLTVIAASTAHNYVDVRLMILVLMVKIALFSLSALD